MTIAVNPVGLADRHVPLLNHEDLQLITAANGLLAQQDYLAALDRMDRLRLRAAGKTSASRYDSQLPAGYRRFVSVDSYSHAWHARFARAESDNLERISKRDWIVSLIKLIGSIDTLLEPTDVRPTFNALALQ